MSTISTILPHKRQEAKFAVDSIPSPPPPPPPQVCSSFAMPGTKKKGSSMLALSKAKGELTKAQRLYIKLCGSNKARPDAEFLKSLPDQLVQMTSVDMCEEKELDIIGMLAAKMTKTEHINLKCRGTGGSGEGESSVPRKRGQARGESEEIPILTPGPCLKLCKSLTRCILQSPGLVSLSLGGVPLKGDALRCLGKGVVESTSLKKFSIPRCQIGDDGYSIINRSLMDSSSLTDIDLSGNDLHDASAVRIASMIRRHSARRDDEYWASCLRSGGEEGLVPRGPNPSAAEIAVQLRGLVALDLSGNELGDPTIRILGDVLERDDWLVALNLLDNGTTTKGATILKNALNVNESLAAIDFRPQVKIPSDLRGIATETIRPTVTGDIPAPVVNSLIKRDPRTAGWMMTRDPRKGISAAHPVVYNILARWGWYGLREGEAAEKPKLPKPAKKKKKRKSKGSTATKKGRASTGPTTMTRMKSAKASRRAANGSKADAAEASGQAGKRKKTKKRGKGKVAVATVVLPRPQSAPSTDRQVDSFNSYKKSSSTSRQPKTKLARATEAAARVAGTARPQSARGRRRPRPALSLSSNTVSGDAIAFDPVDGVLDLRLSKEGIDALRAVFNRHAAPDGSGEPVAPLGNIVAELRKNANACALLNIPPSTPTGGQPSFKSNSRTMTFDLLVQFFLERSDNAVNAASSPRKKSHGVQNQAFLPGSPRVFLPDGTPGNTEAVLEQLEGWVSQMNNFIDRAEEDPTLLNSAKKKLQEGPSVRLNAFGTPEKDSTGQEKVVQSMTPEELRTAIAGRLKDMFNLDE